MNSWKRLLFGKAIRMGVKADAKSETDAYGVGGYGMGLEPKDTEPRSIRHLTTSLL